MSRIIIKNLPKNITEDKLKQLFSEKGTVTDIQLKYTSDGKFRQFGFVGYQNESEADDAIESFDKTFLNTSRITVEKCAILGDKNKPKAWSKYATDSTAFKNANETKIETESKEKSKKKKTKEKKKDEAAELLEKYKDDPMFDEFLQVHAPKESEKLHNLCLSASNEDSAIESDNAADSNTDESENEQKQNEKLAEKDISDLEYMRKLIKGDSEEHKPRQKMEKQVKSKVKLFTLKLRDLPYKCKKKDVKQFFKPNTPNSIRLPRGIHGIAYVGFKNEKHFKKALLKDRSFINGHRVSVMKYAGESLAEKEQKGEQNSEHDTRNTKWKNQEEALKNEEEIAESGRIFFRNLSYTTTEDDIEKLFSKYGPIAEVNLPIDPVTKKIKGFGTVTYLMPEHAVKAFSGLDFSILHGRTLHLLPAKAKDSVKEDLEESTDFKKKKAAKLKSQSNSSHNWNALFLGHDAVADVISDTYNTSKENIVCSEGKGSAAVRLALGETKIVADTRKYLEREGVVLDAFAENVTKKSKTVLLVKNLPARTEVKEIRQLFEKHGEVGRVILPPSGITAVVEFFEPAEAKKAYMKLAYSKFKNMPLYLEWAPENSLVEQKTDPDNKNVENDTSADKNEIEIEVEAEEEEEPEPDTTLFVKNLNFETTDDDLRKHFEHCGKIFYASVATKKNKTDPDKKLSMGYGFVRFFHKAGADKALKTLQQSVLDGKSLELKRSERTLKNEVNVVRKPTKLTKQTGTKILVRNVPFQAKKQELFELFSTFGQIKALRLPKKIKTDVDSHRGFAFIDYTTPNDAKSAFESLSQSTHLYGRRLVLEWASKDEDVEEIRKRTAESFKNPEHVTKKQKKSVFNVDE